jgi:hypothetical protein
MGDRTALGSEPSEVEQFLRTPDAHRVLNGFKAAQSLSFTVGKRP